MALIMALIGIGLYPDVGSRKKGATVFMTEKGRKAKIHSGSVNSKLPAYKTPCKTGMEFVGYQDLVHNTSTNAPPGAAKLMMLNTTPISPFALLLTCGTIKEISAYSSNELLSGEEDDNEVEEEEEDNSPTVLEGGDVVKIRVDGWLTMKINKSALNLIHACRVTITRAMEVFLADPESIIPDEIARAVDAIAQALSVEQPCSGTNYTVSAMQQSAHGSYSSRNDDGRGYGGGDQGQGQGRDGSSSSNRSMKNNSQRNRSSNKYP